MSLQPNPTHPDPSTTDALLRHSNWIRGLALELCRDHGEAEDLVQETWLAFLNSRPGKSVSLRAWLEGMLRGLAQERGRKESEQRVGEVHAAQPEVVSGPDDLIVNREDQKRIVDAVQSLAEPYRSVMLLHFFHGLSSKHIGEMPGRNHGTVRSQLHRGLRQLRVRLVKKTEQERRAWALGGLLPRRGKGMSSGRRFEPLVQPLVWSIAGAVVLFTLAMGVNRYIRADSVSLQANERPASEEVPLASSNSEGNGRVALEEQALHKSEPLSFRLIDQQSGLPLPDYRLRVGDELVVSNAEGVVALLGASQTIVPVDHPDLSVDGVVEHGHRHKSPNLYPAFSLGGEHDSNLLRVPAGPTFRMQIHGMPALPLMARLRLRPTGKTSDDGQDHYWAPIRRTESDHGQAWVRFGACPGWSAAVANKAFDQWTIELLDERGFWWAQAGLNERVLATRRGSADRVGIAESEESPEEIALTIQETGVLSGQVRGVPLARIDGITVSLIRANAAVRTAYWSLLDSEGRFEIRWVLPGSYVLRMDHPNLTYKSGVLTILGGESKVEDVEAEGKEVAGPISGVMTSASGEYRGSVLLFLLDEDGKVIEVIAPAWKLGEGEVWTAPFEFAVAPPGGLRLEAMGFRDALTFRGPENLLQAPFDRAQLEILDQAPSAEWVFEPVDALTGVALHEVIVDVHLAGGSIRRLRGTGPKQKNRVPGEKFPMWTWELATSGFEWGGFQSASPLPRLPLHIDWKWSAHGPGYKPVQGNQDSFWVERHGQRVVRVELEREDPESDSNTKK